MTLIFTFRDEVAKTIGHNISAKEAMLRFDEHFIRGPMGRHASSNKYWLVIEFLFLIEVFLQVQYKTQIL